MFINHNYVFATVYSIPNYGHNKYIDNDYQYVGEGYKGTAKLNYTEEYRIEWPNRCVISWCKFTEDKSYVQLGYAGTYQN